jgi:lipid-binding SYLF domain-containing protein
VGGSYGQGEVYEKKKLIGYATMSQFTVGVQIGGDSFSELILFESKEALDRFKRGKVEFAANASAVLVRAGTAKVNDYEKGVKTMAMSSGGMLLEAAIGGQKFTFKPAAETEQSGGEKKRASSTRREAPGQRASSARKKPAESARHARPAARMQRRSVSRSKRR